MGKLLEWRDKKGIIGPLQWMDDVEDSNLDREVNKAVRYDYNSLEDPNISNDGDDIVKIN